MNREGIVVQISCHSPKASMEETFMDIHSSKMNQSEHGFKI